MEFIIIAVWKRLVGGVKVFLLRKSSNYMLLWEGEKGDASKLDIPRTSDAICIITHSQGPFICRKKGDRCFITIHVPFLRVSPKWESKGLVSWSAEGVAKATR